MEIGLILGSGLGTFADSIENKISIPYSEIPYFAKPTVHSHAGNLVFGDWKGKKVVAMQGRLHYYEGHSMAAITFPVRVMKLLGVKKLLLTNASGSINSVLEAGDFMIIRDHVNLMGKNPLIGPNEDALGTRFPDQTQVYDEELRQKLRSVLKSHKLPVKEGVYAAFSGPSFESAAEIKMAQRFGCDVAGMSTVPEAMIGNHMGLKIAGISCVCNLATGISQTPLT